MNTVCWSAGVCWKSYKVRVYPIPGLLERYRQAVKRKKSSGKNSLYRE